MFLDVFLVDGVLDSRSLVDVSGEAPQVRVVHDPLLVALGGGGGTRHHNYYAIKLTSSSQPNHQSSTQNNSVLKCSILNISK